MARFRAGWCAESKKDCASARIAPDGIENGGAVGSEKHPPGQSIERLGHGGRVRPDAHGSSGDAPFQPSSGRTSTTEYHRPLGLQEKSSLSLDRFKTPPDRSRAANALEVEDEVVARGASFPRRLGRSQVGLGLKCRSEFSDLASHPSVKKTTLPAESDTQLDAAQHGQ